MLVGFWDVDVDWRFDKFCRVLDLIGKLVVFWFVDVMYMVVIFGVVEVKFFMKFFLFWKIEFILNILWIYISIMYIENGVDFLCFNIGK